MKNTFKKRTTLLLILANLMLMGVAFAQAPQGFNYQATVRNNLGTLIVNQNIYFKFNLMLNSSTSVPVYSETHYVPTDDLGAVNLVIGQGTPTTGTFSNINWGTGNYYLGIELNTGSGYVAMGTTQLLSVPFALYANSSASSTPQNLSSVLNAGNSANNTKIINLGDPVNPKDAVNKDYVDAQILLLQNYINSLPVTDIDGNTYLPVTICNQTWTKSNLNVSHYRNGDEIPQVTDPSAWANLTTGAWCYYNNDPVNGGIYGKLYNWYAVNDPRGLAPVGYHIPSDIEWRTLTTCLGGEIVAGGKMKESASSQTDAYSWYYDSEATNSSGFSARPASWRYTESSGTQFGGNKPIKMDAIWWSSTGYESGVASLRNIQASSNSLIIQVFSHIKSNGLSIRCVKD